jgi:hypothetical protein
LTELWGIAYSLSPLIERRYNDIIIDSVKTEEYVKKIIEKKFNGSRMDFEQELRRQQEWYGRPRELMIRVWIRDIVKDEVEEEYFKFIGREKEWDTKKYVDKILTYLRENKLPYILKVFKNISDIKFVEDELRATASRIKKFPEGEYRVVVFAIPDHEEDPPEESSNDYLYLAIGLASAGMPILFRLISKAFKH